MPKDACYYKVKSRYRVFPSAYASGAIAKCRKVGAANYGKSSSKKKKRKTRKAAEGGIITLQNGELVAGRHSIQWNANNTYGQKVPSGVYLYKVTSDNRILTG